MKHTISILVENQAGVLARIAGLFARRAYNIYSLAVGVTEDERISRVTIVADGSDYTLEQILKQLFFLSCSFLLHNLLVPERIQHRRQSTVVHGWNPV